MAFANHGVESGVIAFADKTLTWQPYPSIIDGIANPFVFNRGSRSGNLYLAVYEADPSTDAFGIVLPYKAFAVVDEFLYSCTGPANTGSACKDGFYIKETRSSEWITAWEQLGRGGEIRHFLFVGLDDCIEVLTDCVPEVIAFADLEKADAWGADFSAGCP